MLVQNGADAAPHFARAYDAHAAHTHPVKGRLEGLAETRLRDQVDNALDEARMLILGAQVSLGFQFQAVFQSGFDKLSELAQGLTVVGLDLMLIAAGLLLAPGMYHQIVEGGNDSPRLISFTNGITTLALLPFALGMSIDVYITASAVLGAADATAFAVGAAALALCFWYGLEWILRRPDGKEPAMEETDLSTRIKHVLTEARVVLPGAQALLGFQFIAVLTDSFSRLPESSQYIHLASLGLMVVTIVFLMAPAAFHRIVEHGRDAPRVHTFASIMLLSAMVPLALGIAGDSYVVVLKVTQSQPFAVTTAGLALVFFYGLWFGLTLLIRAAR